MRDDEPPPRRRPGAAARLPREEGDVLLLGAADVEDLLAGREGEALAAVRAAYLAHGAGKSSLPHSSFLRFPGRDADRIIALPAYLGDGFDVAGIKWISSFPGNLERGLARASAVIILNSCRDGRPEAILEGSLVSATRTAASAAAAAAALLDGRRPELVGLVGTGPINRTIARFLTAALPALSRFLLYDLAPAHAERAAARLRESLPGAEATVAASLGEVLRRCPLVSFATTAARPHVADLALCPPGATILHVSLRDLSPAAILAADNVVDDADHVCRAGTSLHLAEQETGGRAFIRCALADVLRGTAPPRRDPGSTVVFSPFGLGILDLAVAHLVRELALASGRGTVLPGFQPPPET